MQLNWYSYLLDWYVIDQIIMQITLVLDSVVPTPFVWFPQTVWRLFRTHLRWPPFYNMADTRKFWNILIFKPAILQYGRQGAISKYNLTLKSVIFNFNITLQCGGYSALFKLFKTLLFLKKR